MASTPSPIFAAHPQLVDLWQFVQGRRSIRRYLDKPIPRELLQELLAFAMWAPSAHNRQPWRFCVVVTDESKQRLSARMGEQWRQDLEVDGTDPAQIERQIEASHARIAGAAALIVVSVSMEDMDVYPDALRSKAEWTMAVQSAALACQNLLLAAHAAGLGACWMCAPLFVPVLVRKVLELPDPWRPQALITLGYPAEEKTREREATASRMIWR